MSYEVWGEPEDSPFEAAIEAGWLDPVDLSRALIDVMNERGRQQDKEGWTPEHDDKHGDGEMVAAAINYAGATIRRDVHGSEVKAMFSAGGIFTGWWKWPWDASFWKPSDRRRDLVKAGALILAEIDRLDRLDARAASGAKP